MALLVYKFSDYEHTAEREQYRAICKQLKSLYAENEGLCIFIANYNIYDCELDGILIKNDAIMCVEFKNYGGTVIAVDNGNWKLSDGTIIKGGSRKSVYQQANINHVAIKRGLKDGNVLSAKTLQNVAALVVFHQPIILENRLSQKTQSWLHICDESSFIEKVEDITSKTTNLSNNDILELVDKMALDEDYLDNNYSNIEVLKDDTVLSVDCNSQEEPYSLNETLKQKIHEDKSFSILSNVIADEESMDEEKQGLTSFVNQIVKTIIGEGKCRVFVVKSRDAYALFEEHDIHLSQKYIIVLEGSNIESYCQKLSKFTNHVVQKFNTNLIYWQDGPNMDDIAIETSDVTEIQQSSTDIDLSSQVLAPKILSPRKCKTVLPHWLDIFLFSNMQASYAPEHNRYEYNLDLNQDEIKVYLGTYFPRSYAETFCIYDNILSNKSYLNMLNEQNVINILDIGCGTGGELFGVITSITKYLSSPKVINIYACDGNAQALEALEEICNVSKVHTHHQINLTTVRKLYALKTKLDTKEIEKFSYDIILCNKVICELISKKIMSDNAYTKIVNSLSPLLSDVGLLLILDVTTKDEHTGYYYPQIMNKGLNNFVSHSSVFQTLLPISCVGNDKCENLCFMQQIFYVSHSRKNADESKVCYRILCRKNLSIKLLPSDIQPGKYVINKNKFKQGDDASVCKMIQGERIIDPFNINL